MSRETSGHLFTEIMKNPNAQNSFIAVSDDDDDDLKKQF